MGKYGLHRTWAVVAAAVVAVVVAGCGSSGSASSPSSSDGAGNQASSAPSSAQSNGQASGQSSSTGVPAPASSPTATTDVTYLTDYVANGVYSPVFYGIQHGYYKAQGINLKVVFGTGSSTTVQQVSTGKADIGDAFSGVIAQGVAKGAPITSVGFFRANGAFAFFCDKKLNITTFQQLKGKTVIIPPGTVQAALYPGALKAAGLSPSDITVQGIASKTAGSVYAGGQGDCISETLGDSPTFQTLRPSTVLLWSKGGFDLPGFGFFATNDYISKNPKIIEGFLKATYKSISESLKDSAAAISAYMSANPSASKDLVTKQWGVSQTVFCTTAMADQGLVIGYQSPSAWDTVVKALQTYQNLPKTVKSGQLFTNKFFDNDKVSGTKCTAKIAS